MLVWWAMSDPDQPLLPADTVLEIEHIYARKRNEVSPLASSLNLESLGNKSVLEKRVNIRAADYRFEDKKKHYLGYVNDKGQHKDGTQINELVQMASTKPDFLESDIEARTDQIINSFVAYLDANGLVKSS